LAGRAPACVINKRKGEGGPKLSCGIFRKSRVRETEAKQKNTQLNLKKIYCGLEERHGRGLKALRKMGERRALGTGWTKSPTRTRKEEKVQVSLGRKHEKNALQQVYKSTRERDHSKGLPDECRIQKKKSSPGGGKKLGSASKDT